MASHYPIGQLLERCIQQSGKRHTQFLSDIGYKNLNNALRTLRDFLESGNGNPYLIERLLATFPHLKQELQRALSETALIRDEEARTEQQRRTALAREHFKPYLFVETERRSPSPLFVAALLGRRAQHIDFIIPHPTLSDAQQVAREHFIRFEGRSIAFGAITGYRFIDTFDTSLRLSTDGTVVDSNAGALAPRAIASLTIGKRTLSPQLLKRLGFDLADENVN